MAVSIIDIADVIERVLGDTGALIKDALYKIAQEEETN